MHAPRDLPVMAADILARIRARTPRVHCITNSVAQNFTANMLLAAGAVPSMTTDPAEIREFVASADALLVNLGTLDGKRQTAINDALGEAQGRIPWVLDPVFVDRALTRAAFALELAAQRPSVMRLNDAEFSALAEEPAVSAALERYARERETVVALTGDPDIVTDGARVNAIRNGHLLMAKVTAMGCAASALVGACLAVEADAWQAAAAGLILIGIAGELAAHAARGPGSLAAGILDALHALDQRTIVERARVE
ncbi:MAG TPA: hydroxyethylthiazole kinase [Xanthobacteraceae bacterium]|nr:hydroxyethylthiazole kinase [Xanthobacteraceae bacterium]